ncbi:MAG: hypothetical protein NC432_08790 [Roseburia sp.]|nr:hypothetical protein [Roseburia sp.]MCM1097790.1 hypothetical protein [Ruminococcus flavefaciens]
MKLEIEGLDELIGGLENIMDLPRTVQRDMLNAEADVVVRAQKKKIDELGLVDSGQLKASIARERDIKTDRIGVCMDIRPQGYRADGISNAEVGFVHEYGAPKRHIKASSWMRKANEECADEAVKAAADVYEKFLQDNL